MSRDTAQAAWSWGDEENSSVEFSGGDATPDTSQGLERDDGWGRSGSWNEDHSGADDSEGDESEAGQAGALDAGIAEALDGEHRAEELRELVAALRIRAGRLATDLSLTEDPAEQERLRQHLQEVEEQIQVLSEEASIVRFVEDSVRFSHQVRRLSEG